MAAVIIRQMGGLGNRQRQSAPMEALLTLLSLSTVYSWSCPQRAWQAGVGAIIDKERLICLETE